MDRRNFNKLLAGTLSFSGVLRGEPAQALASPTGVGSKSSFQGSGSLIPEVSLAHKRTDWELVILDACPTETMQDIGGTAVGDIDKDGKTEVIISGNGGLVWYRPSTGEKGVIARGVFGVGVALADVDGDGRLEVIATEKARSGASGEKWVIWWYKFGANLHDSWTGHIVDDETAGNPHDVVLADLDGDGKHELIATAMYSNTPGLYAYKIPSNPHDPWKKQAIQIGLSAEGTSAGDLNGDGKDEVVCGPFWFSAPSSGAFSGEPWVTHALAPGFREMCRSAVIDINGDGHLDVVVVEDEYPDGRLSWFENRLHSAPNAPWVEHPITAPLNFPHTLQAWHDSKTRRACLLIGEMNEGGWAAPYNWNARLIVYAAVDGGKSWSGDIIYEGEGTHQGVYAELDGSGEHVIFGHAAQVMAKGDTYTGWVQMFRPRAKPSKLEQFRHMFVDRQKPYTGIEILAVNLRGTGASDIVCGAWWYENPGWERHTIPGIAQIINAYDIDNDGREELIGIKGKPGVSDFYGALNSDLVWLKPVDLSKDRWEEHAIGIGDGDWPHGSVVAPLLPGGRLALVCGYHDDKHRPPQIFEIPDDPRAPWPKRVIADIRYGEQMVAYDLDDDGKLDVVAGPYWLENLGDGRFEPHLLIDPELLEAENLKMISRVAIADLNGDGRPDILFTVEDVDYKVRKAFFAPVGWLENTGAPRDRKFKLHIIDRIRSPHSLSVADLDGDGELEIVAGEHDPFTPYRSQARVYAYKKANAHGLHWSRFQVDNRFSSHVGTKVAEISAGRRVILSHSWFESTYVHLWELGKA